MYPPVMRMLVACVLSLSALAASVSAEAPARASEVDRLVEQGLDLRTNGRDAEALVKFRAAHAISSEPRTLAQIALAEQALGLWGPAYEHLRAALARRDDTWIDTRAAKLEGALKQIEAQLGALEVACNVAGATLLIAEHEVAKLPLLEPLRMKPGTYTVELRADGHESASRRLTVVRSKLARVAVELKPTPPRVEPAPAEPASALSQEKKTVQAPVPVAAGLIASLPAASATGPASPTTIHHSDIARSIGAIRLYGGFQLGVSWLKDDPAEGVYNAHYSYDPEMIRGMQVGGCYVWHGLGIGPEIRLHRLWYYHSYENDRYRMTTLDLLIKPRAGYQFSTVPLELYGALPVGFSRFYPHADDQNYYNKFGKTLAVVAGASYFVTHQFGLNLEAGWGRQWFDYRYHSSNTSSAESGLSLLTFEQVLFSGNLVVAL